MNLSFARQITADGDLKKIKKLFRFSPSTFIDDKGRRFDRARRGLARLRNPTIMHDDARSNYIEPHREGVALRAENEALHEELAKHITDRDYLTTTVLPAIEAEYNLKIGGLECEAFTLECHVAGMAYRDLNEIEPALRAGDELTLRREPDNEHDDLAIQILTADGTHLGYVPRAKNETLARLMDAGKFLFARLTEKRREKRWLKIDIQIYMHEL